MNQILITESDKLKNKTVNKNKKVKNNNTPLGMKSILKTFAILILAFGIAISGSGTYAMIQNVEDAKSNKKPIVEVIKKGNVAEFAFRCENGIRTISYNWNNATSKIIQGRGKKEIHEQVSIPEGKNKIDISVIDSKGKTTNYTKVLQQDERDITEPTIEFEVINSNIKIIAKDDKEIDYITYQYGENEKITIKAEEVGQIKIEQELEVVQGENILKVEAVDKSKNTAEREKKIKGTKRPTIEVIPDPNDKSYLIIKAHDEEGLRMISYFINDQEYKTDPNVSLNSKTFEWKQKVEPGETKVLVHAYNINEQVGEFNGIYNY